MIRSYHGELTGTIHAYGEAWVEVEEVVGSDGKVDEVATMDRVRDAVMKDIEDDKIIWDHDGGVSNVEIIDISED